MVQETKKLLVYLESSPQAHETAMVRVLFRLARQIDDIAHGLPEPKAAPYRALAGRVRRLTTEGLQRKETLDRGV